MQLGLSRTSIHEVPMYRVVCYFSASKCPCQAAVSYRCRALLLASQSAICCRSNLGIGVVLATDVVVFTEGT